MRVVKNLVYIGLVLGLSGCDSGSEYEDLTQYMDEVRARPKGKIESLPDFTPYEAFTYGATGLRSPFDEMLSSQANENNQFVQAVRPDAARVKQFLEGFSFDSFSMVGTLNDDRGYHALLDLDGSVYRVKVGDYLGRDHGRVVKITDNIIHVLEIVRNGLDNWVERPRTIRIKDS